jgi:hypothetical protein
MGDWVFVALLAAAVLHILEEYVYPGGFPEGIKRLLPRATHLFTPRFHWVVNGLLFRQPSQRLAFSDSAHGN